MSPILLRPEHGEVERGRDQADRRRSPVLSSTSVTVSETPSTAIEPFSATYRRISGGAAIRTTSQCSRGLAARDRAGAVDVALDDVAAEPGVRGDRALEVDRCEPFSALPRLVRCSVSLITSAVKVPSPVLDHGEATAVDRDRVAVAGVLGHLRAADGEPGGVAVQQVEGLDRAQLFDDSGEHLVPSQGGQGEPDVVAEASDVRKGEAPQMVDRFRAEVADGGEARPEQRRSDVRDDLVDQAGAQERGRQRRAALEPEVPDLVVVELPQYLGGVVGRQQQGLGAVVADPRGALGSRGRRPRRGSGCRAAGTVVARRGRSARGRRRARSGCRRRSRRTRPRLRCTSARAARAGDPLARPVRRRAAAVEGGRELPGDERAARSGRCAARRG